MIKLDKFALMGAFVLTGALGFTACSSDDIADVEPNPTFDGESVKTQFAINIPYAKGGTRMSDVTVQQNNNFRGMQDIYLVSTTGSTATDFSYITGLGNITALDNNSGSDNNGNYKLYSDVNIPTGTKYFHFYGQATKGSGASNMENGVIETNLTTAADRDAIEFKLRTINSDNTTTTFSGGMKKMVDYLNAVATALGSPTGPSELKNLYDEFIKMKAASANSLLIAMQTLYDNLPSGAENVKTAILGESNSVMSVDGSGKLSWNTAKYAANFPENVGLPQGVAMVEWNSGESKFVQAVPGGNSYKVDAAKICYPAALYYYIGTNAKTYTSEYNSWPNSSAAWESETWSGWGDEVIATTRTVALEDNVQYAVGNLKTTVRCTAGSLPDNADELGTQGKVNYVPVGEGFPVTAIIVGGQPDKVGYDFTGGTTFDYNIYDKFPANTVAKNETTASNANYTLVLDNSKDGNTNKTVYFALELTNNSGINFYGHDGLIANGMKFYLIGELDPTEATFSGTGAKPTNVFTKDYVTTANVKISSLADAYVTIPDLRAERLSLGLSVDLTWQTGLEFDVEIK